jgi:hypothetical protein
MRAIFILLLAANLVFFGYQYLFVAKNEAAPDAKVKTEVSAGGGLQLLFQSCRQG